MPQLSLGAMAGAGSVSVSYTHLDVYKRQCCDRHTDIYRRYSCAATMLWALWLQYAIYTTASVSYTHPDVFKRQAAEAKIIGYLN